MAPCTDNLRGILHQSSITKVSSQGVAILKENDPSNPYEIELKGLPTDSLLVKIDRFKEKTDFSKRQERHSKTRRFCGNQ